MAQSAGVTDADTAVEAEAKIKAALGNAPEADEAAVKILQFAANGEELLIQFVNRIRKSYRDRINNLRGSDSRQFNINHYSDSDIQEIVAFAYGIGWFEKRISDKLFIGSRIKKSYY